MPTTAIVQPDGTALVRSWAADNRPSLDWLQRAVAHESQDKGYIEPVDQHCPDSMQAYGNEEARLFNPPMLPNVPAMRIVNWPAPPEGWEAYDGEHYGNPPRVQFFTSVEEMRNAPPVWFPICGPIVVMRGFRTNARPDTPDDLGDKTDATAFCPA